MSEIWTTLISGGVSILVVTLPIIISSVKNKHSIEAKLDAHIKEDEWYQAKDRRIRILRFYDEICEGKMHSQCHFEEILEDIDEYENFCTAHPDFHNNKGKIAMTSIKTCYYKAKQNNNFLVHREVSK